MDETNNEFSLIIKNSVGYLEGCTLRPKIPRSQDSKPPNPQSSHFFWEYPKLAQKNWERPNFYQTNWERPQKIWGHPRKSGDVFFV